MQIVSPSPLLRTALWLDATGSGTLAVLQLAAPALLSEYTALAPGLITGTGAFTLAYAALLVVMATRVRLAGPLVWLVIVGNVGWALGCALLAFGGTYPAPGLAYLAFQAVAVLLFAALQAAGLVRAKHAGGYVPA